MFKPSNTASNDITKVIAAVKKGDFEVQVASTATLSVGQYVNLYQRTTDNLKENMPGLTPNINWGAIRNNGIRPYEKHLIIKISGNKVTFKNPVQLNLPVSSTTVLKTYSTISEVGVEDILFSSAWKDYPEKFVHHANAIVDYAWQAVFFENVVNGWIKNCDFKDWNECVFIEKSTAITVKNIHIYGKRGHSSYYSRYSYGVLFENCLDTCNDGLVDANRKGMLHGPGMRWSTTSSVFLNCTMQPEQPIDCHGYHPYSNLIDNTQGGTLVGNGGAENAYPNSGPYLTFWNFKHVANFNSRLFDFWFVSNTTARRTHTFANPIFVGFQTKVGDNIRFQNEGVNQLRGEQVYPNSLFDAQLQLRLYNGYMSASSSKKNTMAVFANDNKTTTFWESNGAGLGEWLMLDLGITTSVSDIIIREQTSTINDWKIEYWTNNEWKEATSGSGIGAEKNISFDVVSTRKIRFKIVNMLAGQENAPATISEFKVDRGSLQLAANNFSIRGIGETCLEKNNGKVVINAAASYNYIATINENSYNFTDTVTTEDLSPGTYELCITVDGEDFEQCYQVPIAKGETLSGKIAVSKDAVDVSVDSGIAPYTVLRNGEAIFQTNKTNFSVTVNDGDTIQVKSKESCQGEMETTINFLENIKAYPNPSSGSFEIFIPGTLVDVNIEVYNIRSQLLEVVNKPIRSGKILLDMQNKANGIYFVKLNLDQPVFLKLIKRE